MPSVKDASPWCWWFIDADNLYAIQHNTWQDCSHLVDRKGFDPLGKHVAWHQLQGFINEQTDTSHAVVLGPSLSDVNNVSSNLALRCTQTNNSSFTNTQHTFHTAHSTQRENEFFIHIPNLFESSTKPMAIQTHSIEDNVFVIPKALVHTMCNVRLVISAASWLHFGMPRLLDNTEILIQNKNKKSWICHWHNYVFFGAIHAKSHNRYASSIRQFMQSNTLWQVTFGDTFSDSTHWYFGVHVAPQNKQATQFIEKQTYLDLDCSHICVLWENAIHTLTNA